MSDKTFRAVHRRAPISPRKARYVLDMIRGKPVSEALDVLRFSPKRAAPMLTKVVMSALASAQLDDEVDHNRLHVVDVRADHGPTMKRYTPRARGQMFPLLLRYAHLTVVLAEREPAKKRARAAGTDRSRRARVEASRRADLEKSAEGAAVPSEPNEENA